MDKSNVEKWLDGSVVDEWLNSKAYQKFQTYHPYLTFSAPLNNRFVNPSGKHFKDMNQGEAALFRIGAEAYKLLPEAESREAFDLAHSGYFEWIETFRTIFRDWESNGKLKIKNLTEEQIDWSNTADNQIVDMVWQLFPQLPLKPEPEISQLIAEFYLFHALTEIDNAIIAMQLNDSEGSICAAIEASSALSNAMAIESGNEKLQESRREFAYLGAMAKIERDPKQAEKKLVKECWQEWQRDPNRYKGKAAFARDMLDKFEHLTSQKKIEDWCRDWEKSAPSQHGEH